MRIYVGVVVALVLVLMLGFFMLYNLDNSADKMVADFKSLDNSIATGNWDEAMKGIEKVQKIWDRQKGWWAMALDHQEIDNIDMSLNRIDKYVSMHDRSMASAELAVLKHMLEHIPEKEQVTFQNIF